MYCNFKINLDTVKNSVNKNTPQNLRSFLDQYDLQKDEILKNLSFANIYEKYHLKIKTPDSYSIPPYLFCSKIVTGNNYYCNGNVCEKLSWICDIEDFFHKDIQFKPYKLSSLNKTTRPKSFRLIDQVFNKAENFRESLKRLENEFAPFLAEYYPLKFKQLKNQVFKSKKFILENFKLYTFFLETPRYKLYPTKLYYLKQESQKEDVDILSNEKLKDIVENCKQHNLLYSFQDYLLRKLGFSGGIGSFNKYVGKEEAEFFIGKENNLFIERGFGTSLFHGKYVHLLQLLLVLLFYRDKGMDSDFLNDLLKELIEKKVWNSILDEVFFSKEEGKIINTSPYLLLSLLFHPTLFYDNCRFFSEALVEHQSKRIMQAILQLRMITPLSQCSLFSLVNHDVMEGQSFYGDEKEMNLQKYSLYKDNQGIFMRTENCVFRECRDKKIQPYQYCLSHLKELINPKFSGV
jgi:hypothetical protein